MWKVIGSIGFVRWDFVVYEIETNSWWGERGTACLTNNAMKGRVVWSMN